MTDLEKQALETFREVRDCLCVQGPVLKATYMAVLGHVRDMITRLENKYYGCPTGMHQHKCTCKPPVLGKHA